jgi:hypothetical protein
MWAVSFGSVLRRTAAASLWALYAAPILASSLEVQNDNAIEGEFAARVHVESDCAADVHELITGTIGGGAYVACSSLTSDADLASGAATFTAGDLVILRNGFTVSEGTLTVEIDRALYPDAWVQDDTPDGETVYSARFYIDPTSLNLTDDGNRFFHFLAFDAGGDPELRVGVRQTGTEKRVFFEVFEDNGGWHTTEGVNEFFIPPGWHWIDVYWQASTGVNDGLAYLCLDSPAPPGGCIELSNLDNDTGAINFVRWGAVDVPSSTDLGQLDLDDFQSTDLTDGFESGNTDAWSATSEEP